MPKHQSWGRPAFVGIALAGLFVWAACGDDDAAFSPPVTARDSGIDRNPPLRDATVIIEDDGGEEDAAKPVKPRGPYDAGPENAQILDGGGVAVPCVSGGELEVESNDTLETATPISPPQSRCGIARIRANDPLDAGADADAGDAGDADAGATSSDAGAVSESDFMQFRLTKEATNFYVQYHGEGVEILVRAGDAGAPLDITKPGVTLPFEQSSTYYIEVRSKTGKDEPWRVSVFEDQ